MPSFTPLAAARGVQRLLLVIGLATLAGVLVAGLALPLVAGVGLGVRASAETFRDLPAELTAKSLAQRSVVYDADGRVLATFYDENRIYRPLSAMAPIMPEALIATEDARYYEHGPIDLYGTGRALVRNLESGGDALSGQGGSTLTQQYVKLLLVDQAKTKAEIRAATAASPIRKLKELRLAMAAEETLTKEQILERYLNIAYFGAGAYGVEAAARRYFSVTAKQLTLPQAALIAGMVQSPSLYDPTKNPELALTRRNAVLQRMRSVGVITAAEYARTRRLPLGLKLSTASNGCQSSYAPFFCEYVRYEVRDTPSLGPTPEAREQRLRQGGLIIRTTLDAKDQSAAAKAVRAQVYPQNSVAAAIAMVEPGTGKIKAMTQSSKYGTGKGETVINLAANSDRGSSNGSQPGSTFKVFTLAAAIDKGIPTDLTIDSPEQIDVGDVRFRTCDGTARVPGYKPKSSTGFGVYDMYSAAAASQNTFFIQLEEKTGLCRPARFAERMGAVRADGAPLQQVPSFTLGSNEVSPIGMAEAYATLAASGIHCDSRAITEISSLAGKTYAPLPTDCKRVLRRNVANTVTSILEGVMAPGATGAKVALSRPSAGKTGTTDSKRSVWFAGYVPQMAAAVGVWDPKSGQRSLVGRSIGGSIRTDATICGGCLPGPIWNGAMQGALKGVPERSFDAPYGYRSSLPPGAALESVPDVTGYRAESARRVIESAGLKAIIIRQPSTSQRNRVMYTFPGAGGALPSGSSVQVYVSRG